MADVESRREARRRKILDNSEQRMKLLAGQDLKEELYKDNVSPVSISLAAKISRDKESKLAETVEQDVHENKQNNARSADPEIFVRLPKSVAGGTVKISKLHPKTKSNNEPKITRPVIPLSVKKGSTEKHIQLFNVLRIVSCVLVAIAARLVLSLGFGLFYFQSIIAPFFAMEIALFSYQLQTVGSMSLPHKNNMMVGALILCGLKSDVIGMYNRMMGYVSAVTEDFALYLFTFLLSHMFS